MKLAEQKDSHIYFMRYQNQPAVEQPSAGGRWNPQKKKRENVPIMYVSEVRELLEVMPGKEG